MPIYKAPLDDVRFVLNELFDIGELTRFPATRSMLDLIDAVLGEAAKVCENVLQPPEPQRRRGGLPAGERRGHHAQGLQGSLRRLPRGRLDRLACTPTTAGRGCRTPCSS